MKDKISYIDNIRIALTALVILHHAIITYGGPGSWYYNEKTTVFGAILGMTLVVAVNQAFFMGFFFFLSAFFTESSYEKKGTGQFILDRFKRLGIPILFYAFILSPVVNFEIYRYAQGGTATFVQFLGGYHPWIQLGVLWFVAALLIFSLAFVVLKYVEGKKAHAPIAFPSNGKIFLFAFAIGLISTLVRIYFPVGWTLQPFGFQLAHFTQYIALFVLGIVAARNHWLESIDLKRAKQWILPAVLLIVGFFPVMYSIKVATNSPMEAFQGGFSWLSFIAAVWEQLVGFSLIIILLGVGRHYWNRSTLLLQKLSRVSFAVYIIHPFVLISLSLLLRSWQAEPTLKLLIVAPLAIVGSFLLARVMMMVPGVGRIV